MNMNKSLLAAALAAATFGGASSAIALTFTDGDFTGNVDIGGTVTVPVAVNHWQWAAGDAISFASHPVTQMSNGYKTLTLPSASNLPLLVGQTTAATIGNAGNAGLNPQVAFTDASGTTVTPTWDTTGSTGKGTITLPLTTTDGTSVLGSMKIPVKVGAVRAVATGGGHTELQSVFYQGTGVHLYGETATPPINGTLANGSTAGTWNALLGSKSTIDLLDQLNAANGENNSTYSVDNKVPAAGFNDPAVHFCGTYGLGIAQGDDIVLNFTNPVTSNTIWKAPLKMTVTYL